MASQRLTQCLDVLIVLCAVESQYARPQSGVRTILGNVQFLHEFAVHKSASKIHEDNVMKIF